MIGRAFVVFALLILSSSFVVCKVSLASSKKVNLPRQSANSFQTSLLAAHNSMRPSDTMDPASTNGNLSTKQTVLRNVAAVWAVLQVTSVLGNAIKRLVPIAMQPIVQRDLDPLHWAAYVVWVIVMAYSEGYRGFQLKFSPMVVERAFGLSKNASFLNILLAGPYAMGMFGADRKRMLVSWILTAGVFSMVILVKMLPYPYRSIIDAGVVVGLSYGTLSIILLTLRALISGNASARKEA